MNKFVQLAALLAGTLSGCSTSSNSAFIDDKVFKESNRPFLTVYQTTRAQTTMVELDKRNDQVIVSGDTEYVFWKHKYNSAVSGISAIVDIKPKEETLNKSPFTVSASLFNAKDVAVEVCSDNSDSCNEEKIGTPEAPNEIIYDIGECHFKGCD